MAWAESTQPDFSANYAQIYQIRVASNRAGSKSSIGSGFQVSADGLVITNYHVIADFVQAPSQNKLQYRAHDGTLGALRVLNFDVIHDLALLQLDEPASDYFELAAPQVPLSDDQLSETKGQLIYALGNPRDFGVTLVQGFNNGLVEHSYDEQLLFSGSLNPGMSGGPALDAEGKVFGVNVATAGSQLSFLVPVSKVRALLAKQSALVSDDFQTEIATQIKNWQRPRLKGLIESMWPTEPFAERALFGEIRNDFQCWGDANDDDPNREIDYISKGCQAANSAYLSNRLSAGQIVFSFEQQKSLKLNAAQFANSLSSGMRADNSANYEHTTNYQCHVDFVEGGAPNTYRRVSTCIRAYKKLDGLFDSLLSVQEISDTSSFVAHLSIASAEQDQIQQMNAKFMERSL